MLFAYAIPGDSPAAVVTYIFGFVFVAFIPGYCLVNILFATKENKLELLEEVVLSVALSFSLVGLAGLFLGLSPIGINFTSIRLSLSSIVLVLATVAFFRKWRAKRASNVKLLANRQPRFSQLMSRRSRLFQSS